MTKEKESNTKTTAIKPHGGPRPGAGRPRKGEQPRVPISFSVDQSTRDQARRLRSAGFPLVEHIEALVHEKHSWYFNE